MHKKRNGKHRCLMSPRLYVSWSFSLIPQPCFQILEIRTIQDARPPFSPLPLEGAGERSEAGLAPRLLVQRFSPPLRGFLWRVAPSITPTPLPEEEE